MESLKEIEKEKEALVPVEKEKEVPPVAVYKPFTEDDVLGHAAKYGGNRNLREISIVTADNEAFVYLVKKPSRNVLQAIAEENEKGEKKSITTIQKLMLGCVLEGDKEAFEHDGAIYTELLKSIGQLVKTTKADIKKI